MTTKLWVGSGSPYAWRVLLAAQVKDLDYEEQLISFSKREHRSPQFLARNPRGKVPVLESADLVLYESIAILAWMEAQHPDPPLFGTDPASTGRVWQRVAELDNYFAPVMHAFVRPIFFGDPAEERDAVEKAAGVLHRELAGFEALLGQSDWLVGEQLSAADLCLYPLLQLVLRAAGKPSVKDWDLDFSPLEDNYPAIARWAERIEALPGFDRTWPPHWKQSD